MLTLHIHVVKRRFQVACCQVSPGASVMYGQVSYTCRCQRSSATPTLTHAETHATFWGTYIHCAVRSHRSPVLRFQLVWQLFLVQDASSHCSSSTVAAQPVIRCYSGLFQQSQSTATCSNACHCVLIKIGESGCSICHTFWALANNYRPCNTYSDGTVQR